MTGDDTIFGNFLDYYSRRSFSEKPVKAGHRSRPSWGAVVTAPPARPSRSFEAPEHTNGSALSLAVPEALVEAVAERVADLLAERLPAQGPAPWLDVDGAAAYLASPKSRVYELVAAKRVRHYRDGRRVLFKAEDLDAALSVREVET